MNFFKTTYDRWNHIGWIPPLLSLMLHFTHIAGGVFVLVAVFLLNGHSWVDAAILSSAVFFVVELITGMVKGNWKDCTFDFLQYQFQWVMYPAYLGWWYLAAALFIVWLFLYFRLLHKGW